MSALSLDYGSSGPNAARSSVLGSTTPRLYTRPAAIGEPGPCGCGCALTPQTSKGFEAAEFIQDVLGWTPFPWQRWLLIHALELDAFGCFRFRTVLVLVGRQNGKTRLAAGLALWRMLLDDGRMVLGTSTNLDYAEEAWRKAADEARFNEALADEFDTSRRGGAPAVITANGKVSLNAENGARYKIAAATGRGGRSLSVDLLILDELREHRTWDAWSASSKTTNARPNGQKWAITNQGDRTAVVLHRLRAIALASIGEDAPADPDDDDGGEIDDESLFLAEWSAPDGAELTDVSALAQANPSLGYSIAESTLLSDARVDDPDVFRVEVMCQRVDIMGSLIDVESWTSCLDQTGTMDALRKAGRPVALCLDIAPDGLHATLVAAAVLRDGRARIETVAQWDGPGSASAARADLPMWRKRVQPKILGWFPAGPAAVLAPDLKDARGVRPLAGADVLAACQGLVEDIKTQRVLHRADALLAAHLTGAARLDVGDGYRFQRRGASPVDGAYAAAGAVHLARTLPRRVGGSNVVVIPAT